MSWEIVWLGLDSNRNSGTQREKCLKPCHILCIFFSQSISRSAIKFGTASENILSNVPKKYFFENFIFSTFPKAFPEKINQKSSSKHVNPAFLLDICGKCFRKCGKNQIFTKIFSRCSCIQGSSKKFL